MSAAIAAWGRLARDPRPIETRTGTPMTVATLAVDVAGQRDGDDDAEPLWLNVVAFNRLADTLARHAKGDPVSVSGTLQQRAYTASDGERRVNLECVADAILSARAVRPGGGKRKAASSRSASSSRPNLAGHGAPPATGPEPPPFDDPMGF